VTGRMVLFILLLLTARRRHDRKSKKNCRRCARVRTFEVRLALYPFDTR